MHAATLVGLAVLLAGCPDRTISAVPVDQGKVEVMDIPAVPNNKIDLLFVIDSSKSMEDEQDSLQANFSRMVDVLETIRGGLPDVHIGVVTPDLGTSAIDGSHGANVFTCIGDGQGGKLRELAPGGPRFLESRDDGTGTGGRITNFPGLSLTDAFAQLAEVGIAGCGIEQPLEAMKRATDGSNLENAGFLRDDAFLAVVIIADEDDCSLAQGSLFDGNTGDPVYGERVNFRCTEQGVVCDTPSTPFDIAGPRSDCHANPAPSQVAQLARYVQHLESLKADPRSLIVAGIIGDAEPFAIEKRNGLSVLGNACPVASGNVALPAVRMTELLAHFQQSTLATICDDDLSQGLEQIGELITNNLDPACFDNDLADVDPNTPGPQYECSVVEVRRRAGAADEELRVFGACERGELPCWRVQDNPTKCFFTDADPHLELVIDYGTETPGPDIHVAVQCVTTDPSGPVL